MEKKKTTTKKKTKTTRKNTGKIKKDNENRIIYMAVCIGIMVFVLLLIFLKGTFSASGTVTFRGDTGYNLSDTDHYDSPPNGECAIDEYGFMDYQCAHKIACICREWSTTKAGTLKDDKGNTTCEWPCQGTALYNGDIFTTTFNNGQVYYCKGGTSYATACDIPTPTESCYECTVNGGKEHIKTINETRAAAYTGGTNCAAVADIVCTTEPTSTPTPKPTTAAPTTTPKPTTKPATPTKTPTKTPTPTVKPETHCYECTVTDGKSYVWANTKNEALEWTKGTECNVVADNKCETDLPTTSCYKCTVGDTIQTGYYVDESEANQLTGGSCVKVSDDVCTTNPPDNPKTGTSPIIIIMALVGICGIGYILTQLRKK